MTIHFTPTLFALTLRALKRYPDRVAFKWDQGQLTYRQTVQLIGRLQAVLHQAGIKSGSRLALLSANRADLWCAGVAAPGLGATTTWLHPMGSLNAHCFQLEDADVAAVMVDAANYGHRGSEIASSLPDIPVYTFGKAPYGVDLLALVDNAGSQAPVDLSKATHIGTLSYTGGTTGRQKGVAKTSLAAAHAALQLLADFEIPADPRFLAVAPISHVTGTNVLPTLIRGGTVNLMERFDVDKLVWTVARERINFLMMVPTMIYGLLDHPRFDDFDLSSLELLLYAGSPVSRSRLVEGITRIGPVFSQLYGQSECSPITAMRKAEHDISRPESLDACGFPVSGCEVQLLDDESREVKPGEHGEICVRGPSVMQEYWRQPELTQETLFCGWLRTGDIAIRDETGRIYIVDRKKDMIVSGGFNVYPREVEDALATHPAVGMSAVIGAPHAKWGETVLAYVVLRAGTVATSSELIDHVKSLKGSVNAPKYVEFVEALPLTALGKIDKKALRARHWAGQTRKVG
jgi:fatty-acyl-CoA synthase